MTRLLKLLPLILLSLLLNHKPLIAGEGAGVPTGEGAADEIAIITGRVTEDVSGTPLPNVDILLIDPDAPDQQVLAGRTDHLGVYTATQAISATWKVRFVPGLSSGVSYLPEYYNDVYALDEAALITAEVGTAITGINASLAREGQITGRVTTESGEALANVRVSYYHLNDTWEDGLAFTDATGMYTLTTHTHGEYKLRFEPRDADEYALQFSDNRLLFSEATVVTVPEGRDLRGVDVTLTRAGKISGFLTSSWRGQSIEYPDVQVLHESGEVIQVGGRFSDDPGAYEPVMPPGGYIAANLPPGQYQILFKANRHRPVLRTELVEVRAGEITASINAQLPISIQVQSIATSPGISGTIALSFDLDPVPIVTTDGGQRWQILPSTPWVANASAFRYPDRLVYHSLSTAIAPRGDGDDGTRFIVAVSNNSGSGNLHTGLYRSGDLGQSWAQAEVAPPLPSDSCPMLGSTLFAISPATPTALYATYTCAVPVKTGLLVSHNAGVTWQDVTTVEGRSLVLYGLARVVPSPLLPNRVYLYDGSGSFLQSNDGGLHWEEKDFPVESLALDAQNADYLYGWSPRHDAPWTRIGKRSTNGGNSWQDWAQNPCPYTYRDEPPQLIAHPTQSQMLFLRCDNNLTEGLYRSDNGGDEWKKLTDEKGQLLAIDHGTLGRILWAKDDGLWASSDNGESWHVLLANYHLLTRGLYLPTVTANR